MSRSERKPLISKNEINNNWKEIYGNYINLKSTTAGLNALCPFHKESSGSFFIYNQGAYKCFGCGKSGGNVIDFVMNMENLEFVEAMKFIVEKHNLTPRKIESTSRPIVKEETLIEVNESRFEQNHKDYWNKYLLPESYLNSQNIFAVKKLAYNKKVQDISNQTVFAYYAEDINKWKILRIGEDVPSKDKWRNTVPNNYLWYFPKERVDNLFICKSVKDRCVMHYHFGLDSIAVQNEDAISLLSFNYDKIEPTANNKIVVYGSDFQGWHESFLITEYTGWDYLNTPNYLYKYGIEDPSDLVDQVGLESLKELLTKKHYI